MNKVATGRGGTGGLPMFAVGLLVIAAGAVMVRQGARDAGLNRTTVTLAMWAVGLFVK